MRTPEQTLQRADGQWAKLLLICMKKLGVDHVAIGPDDLAAIEMGSAVVLQEGRDGDGLLHLQVVGPAAAVALQSQYAGGKGKIL